MRLLRAACEYADLGWHVLPLQPRAKQPLGRLVPKGLTQATDDLATVFSWWRQEPEANIGIVCKPSGMLVLDVDPRNGGDDDLARGERHYGALPETVCAETGGGGSHFLFRHPEGPLKGKLTDGLDLKSHGYIVAPPSVHPSGVRYEWDLAPGDVPLAEVPPAWLEKMLHVGVASSGAGRTLNRDDPLLRIPADVYIPLLGRREVVRGWACCPFHNGGREQAPSMTVDGALWACHGCPPPPGKLAQGGTIIDFAALVADLPMPLDPPTYGALRRRLVTFFSERGLA